MNAFVPAPRPGDKLRAIFLLGMGSNFFTLAGAVIGMIVLGKTEWIEGFWSQALLAACLSPAFMGDAVNAYVLGRIRLEGEKGWDDVQITAAGRASLVGWFRLWRTLSFLSAAALGGILLTSLAPDPVAAGRPFRVLFPLLFAAHAGRCLYSLGAYVAPVLPRFGGRELLWRAVAAGVFFAGWLKWLYAGAAGPFTAWGFLGHGTAYFLLCAYLQPLPSKFSALAPAPRGPDLAVTRLDEGLENAAERLAIQEATAWWKGEGGFVSLGFLRLPLLELPLFQATGEALLSPDRTSLLLVLISEVRPRVHRALYSPLGERVAVTTDFGAPDARFPDEILYETRPVDERPSAFLARHEARTAGRQRVEDPPWPWLEALVIIVLQFLARKQPRPAGVSGEAPGPVAPDAGPEGPAA